MIRPFTTLFMLMSVDGKISTGDSDLMDVDKDFPTIPGIKEGLNQYYEIEKQTDFFSFNTGRVFAKIGVNNKKDEPEKIPVNFVVIDNKPHLTENGTSYFAKKAKKLFIVTTNKKHPAFELRKKYSNIEILFYESKIDLADMLNKLKTDHDADWPSPQNLHAKLVINNN